MKNNFDKKYLYWFLLVSSFVVLPLLMLFYGYFYLETKINNEKIKTKTEELNRFYAELRKYTDSQKFWCFRLNSKLRDDVRGFQNLNKNFIKEEIQKLKESLDFNYAIVDTSNGTIEHSGIIKTKKDQLNWSLASGALYKRLGYNKYMPTKQENIALGYAIGPQLNLEHLTRSSDIYDPYLVWPDSSLKKPLMWVNRLGQFLVMIFIDYKDFNSTKGFKAYLNEFTQENPDINFVVFDEHNKSDAPHIPKEVNEALDEYEKLKNSLIKKNHYTIFPVFIRHNVKVLGYIKTKTSIYKEFTGIFTLVMALLALYTFFFGRYTWKTYVRGELDALSIRWKLRFLFFFANGLPILVLLFIGMDYLSNKRHDLLQERRNEGIEYLQNLDDKLKVQYAKSLVVKDKAKENFLQNIKKKGLTLPVVKKFHEEMGPYVGNTFIIASESKIVATENGLIRDKKVLVEYEPFRKDDIKHADIFDRIGKYFLAKLNNTKVSARDETEIELLIESVTRKTAPYILYDFLGSRGDFLIIGFGKSSTLSIIDTIALDENSETQDYFITAKFSTNELQYNFLKEAVAQASRNEMGLKIVALKNRKQSVPRESYLNPELRAFSSTLTSYPSKELKFLNYENDNCLGFGFIGKELSDYNLIGLYPTKYIDKIIEKQKNQLITFALVSLFITFSLSQILALSFTKPLMLITTAASAMAKKEFDYRLPDLGTDEFGIMGKIFNDVMVDLDELADASTIQNQLLPDSNFIVKNYSIYGKSIAKSELGGDYFDFINIEEDKFSLMLGDVAGHGVGAALIMAMAKAGVINSQELLKKPQAIVSQLHQLILASKTRKQRKIMTFQYLYGDSNSNLCLYSNAGGCSPMIIRKNQNVVEEFTLQGAALGAFRRAKYDEKTITLEPKDAVVFYTDGLVEARNKDGVEVGYDGLKNILLKTWDINAENYYNNIYDTYMEHIKDVAAEDDLTIIVMVYNPE